MSFVRDLHVILAYVTVAGFALRAIWALMGSARLKSKPARILPHVVDTVLLVCGLALVFGLGHSLASGWLVVKLVALLAYIGFGVLTLRASSMSLRLVGITGALVSVGYIFAVAMTRDPWPLS
jgi:uncharacterized membrane protein SirB2